MGAESFGSKLRFIFNLLTDWNQENYLDYMRFTGPKLITFDPKDEVIPYASSLTIGASNQAFLNL